MVLGGEAVSYERGTPVVRSTCTRTRARLPAPSGPLSEAHIISGPLSAVHAISGPLVAVHAIRGPLNAVHVISGQLSAVP